MIRPFSSGSASGGSVIPALDLPPSIQGDTGAADALSAMADRLMSRPRSFDSVLSESPDGATANTAGIGNGEKLGSAAGVDQPRYGKSDRHPMSNQHSLADVAGGTDPLREAFDDFVGQTLFGQMLASMRSTVGKPAYFHGGRAEEIFSEQLDQVLVEKLSDASASTITDPMYRLFNMQRSQ
jgi:peptidoglycan hydrolase FlgJ